MKGGLSRADLLVRAGPAGPASGRQEAGEGASRGPGGPPYRIAFLVVACLLASCGRYADFTLPAVPGGDPHMTFAFEARPEPVLTGGVGLESGDVLNPSVTEGGRDMFYSAFDGATWRTFRATSPDGLRWERRGVVLSPDPLTWEGRYIAANGSALDRRGEIWYWYQAGARDHPRIGLLRSARKETTPVLDSGPYMSWDERGVADPYVIRIDPYFYLYCLGQDRAHRQRLGVARSTDGVQWEKLRANPILELGELGTFDEDALGEPAVWTSHGFYWMLYTGRDRDGRRRLGLARSTDGVRWRKLPAVFSGTQPWDSQVICDPTVVVEGGTVKVWFGGGDVASPDENLHGQIGFAILRPVDATLTK